ncbi:FKBP-type peptidyl-prolyl cis-trans isomerase [Photobacterium sp. NCIMB 13483]|uniref:Peptidyl-prolyl cis-trans isomerase n=1 Tax=Photobacterium piscicola TaxID=1378299 RepID=A0A1T5HYM9_9GAMM|nr:MULTISPECIES: FKBP-type peptidyl-prolyl cis-trans isomerase [Photobacterium]MEC6822225.1 FKBP-type peptidyl-prolyl cis-trans isomerase [Photobacterium piscicola]MEC6881117.1 FKBP-type peptidyl-prolyl cis-trans isomerase [Photobacterium piscicola]MEC6897368.1 FKBP-type peptidyl-prolyl cis-trans isomerase [Photobacterium piscicola]PST95009.1 FKBP-type peptidyl-prolyl cis-trans isomerase [Photobacterium sp. NCIMB 13483]SKC31862.1 FKBP-type 22 kDa peptidyl-prolyl cis-trans isomerase [Photobacte
MPKIIIAVVIAALVAFFLYRSYSNKQAAQENIKIGQEFLAANKLKEGVQTTASGLQYLVLQQGTGTEHPKATDTVTVHYHGTLINGTVFDSSVDRGEKISFPLNRVIKGWTEGLQHMVVGEKVRFFIPANLAYGNNGAGSIPPGSVLIFDVELFKIN